MPSILWYNLLNRLSRVIPAVITGGKSKRKNPVVKAGDNKQAEKQAAKTGGKNTTTGSVVGCTRKSTA
jgi:hypothetical protein